ncbi:MAG: helix-turn-helix transcriptional regulator [Prevotella sp.]|nr:helix-turn-helix transcriptional regulator [Prevotella sp.]
MARKITVVVETGKDLFSCFISGADDLDFGIVGDGKTAAKAMEDFLLAAEEMKAYCQEQGKDFPELEFDFVFDVGAFFDYYPLNITAFAKRIGMNASQLRQYARGIRTPKASTLARIYEGVKKTVKDIEAGHLIDKPVPQYV